MKVDVAPMYHYVVYEAAIMGSDGQMWTGQRLMLVAAKKLEHKLTTLSAQVLERMTAINAALGEDKQLDPPLAMRMLQSAGLDYIHEFSGPVFLMNTDLGPLAQPVVLADGAKVVSKFDHYTEYAEDTPLDVIRQIAPKAGELVVHQREAEELIKESIERIDFLAESDRKYGAKTAFLADVERLKGDGEKFLAAVKAMGGPSNVRLNGEGAIENIEPIDASNERFGKASITDFVRAKVIFSEGNGKEAEANRLRVAHIDPPEWHATPGDSEGYIGYWQFKEAVLAHVTGGGTDGSHLVAYSPVRNFKVAVKSMDAINPGGMVALPEGVIVSMTGKKPAETMSMDEGREFTLANASRPDFDFATSSN